MTAEDSKKYCFGHIDIRCGIRIIVVLNICVLFLAIVLNIFFLVMILGIKARLFPSSNEIEENTTNKINTIHGLCASSFLEIILLYFNICLKKSIYEKNVQNIKHWLVMYLMVLIHIMIYYSCAAFISDQPLFFLCIGLISSLIVFLMLYVVKRFYHYELEHLATENTTDDNNVPPAQSAEC